MKAVDPILERYYALEEKIKAYNPTLDSERLFSAFTYAAITAITSDVTGET